MNYDKFLYPLAWFSLTLNVLATALVSWCLVGAVGKYGFFHPITFLDIACIAFNVYLFVRGVQRYRDMKSLDESINILEGVLAEVKAEIKAEQKLREEEAKAESASSTEE